MGLISFVCFYCLLGTSLQASVRITEVVNGNKSSQDSTDLNARIEASSPSSSPIPDSLSSKGSKIKDDISSGTSSSSFHLAPQRKSAVICGVLICRENEVCSDDNYYPKCLCKGDNYHTVNGKCQPTIEVDPCDITPCQNLGICEKGDTDAFKCICPDTHTGSTCETLIEIDPCEGTPCQNNGKCEKDDTDGFKCICPVTHTGRTCETQLNPCDNKPCRNGGICINYNAKTFECLCPSTFIGKTCDVEVNPCDNKPCQNGGTCYKFNATVFKCDCTAPFTGQTCDLEVNPCDNKPCQNGGTCYKFNATVFKCGCPAPFMGQTCDLEIEISTVKTTTKKTNTSELTTSIPMSTKSPIAYFNFRKMKLERSEIEEGTYIESTKNKAFKFLKSLNENVAIFNFDFEEKKQK